MEDDDLVPRFVPALATLLAMKAKSKGANLT